MCEELMTEMAKANSVHMINLINSNASHLGIELNGDTPLAYPAFLD